jgi:hypothetical protein
MEPRALLCLVGVLDGALELELDDAEPVVDAVAFPEPVASDGQSAPPLVSADAGTNTCTAVSTACVHRSRTTYQRRAVRRRRGDRALRVRRDLTAREHLDEVRVRRVAGRARGDAPARLALRGAPDVREQREERRLRDCERARLRAGERDRRRQERAVGGDCGLTGEVECGHLRDERLVLRLVTSRPKPVAYMLTYKISVSHKGLTPLGWKGPGHPGSLALDHSIESGYHRRRMAKRSGLA